MQQGATWRNNIFRRRDGTIGKLLKDKMMRGARRIGGRDLLRATAAGTRGQSRRRKRRPIRRGGIERRLRLRDVMRERACTARA